MFPLNANDFPSSAAALQRLLNESLRLIFDVATDPVTVRDASFPKLAEMDISLDDARLRPDPPRPPSISGETSPALEVGRLVLHATALSVGPAEIEFLLSARDVRLGQGKDSAGNIVLLVQKAEEGKIAIAVVSRDLEALIAKIARAEAGKHGVTISDLKLTLRSKSPRSLAAEVGLRAQKLFLSASLRITGQLDLDEQLNARISDLRCEGDGGMATLACGVLTPHLQKLDGREFPLMSLPLGEIQLRDVQLAVGDKLSVTAEFGAAS
ncbi:MAG: hypothetical protein DLM73_14555 [Chthoniobacterales bacterium]|nr:MAG: hypothetical protein DLM73_14555 [Chthoniobacterales bacterium]